MYRHFLKRTIDIILSFLAIIILAIPMLVIAIIIKIDSRGPVLFKQRRIGRYKKEFMMPKFRTMLTEAPAEMPTHLLNDPERWITRSGRWLRRLSLDELPQVFSIFVGKMSIIGPRPALWNQEDLIEARDAYGANDVRPGLSGWAQINGRDELEVDVKARFDGEYVEKLSFWFDCRCFFGSFLPVLRGKGVVEGAVESGDKK